MKNKFIGITDKSFLDLYSIPHFIFGLVIGLIFLFVKIENYFLIGIGVLILWEVFEGLLRYIKKHHPKSVLIKILPDSLFGNESLLNIFSDIIIGSIGLIIIFIISKSI